MWKCTTLCNRNTSDLSYMYKGRKNRSGILHPPIPPPFTNCPPSCTPSFKNTFTVTCLSPSIHLALRNSQEWGPSSLLSLLWLPTPHWQPRHRAQKIWTSYLSCSVPRPRPVCQYLCLIFPALHSQPSDTPWSECHYYYYSRDPPLCLLPRQSDCSAASHFNFPWLP